MHTVPLERLQEAQCVRLRFRFRAPRRPPWPPAAPIAPASRGVHTRPFSFLRPQPAPQVREERPQGRREPGRLGDAQPPVVLQIPAAIMIPTARPRGPPMATTIRRRAVCGAVLVHAAARASSRASSAAPTLSNSTSTLSRPRQSSATATSALNEGRFRPVPVPVLFLAIRWPRSHGVLVS